MAAAAAGTPPRSCIFVRLSPQDGFVDLVDSKTGITFTVSCEDWGDFLDGAKNGEFDIGDPSAV